MTARQRGWLLPPLALSLALGILLGRQSGAVWPGLAALGLALAAAVLTLGRRRFCALLAAGLALGFLRGAQAYHPALPAEGEYMISGIVCAEVESSGSDQIRTVLTQVTLDGIPLRGDAYWTFYAEEIPGTLQPGRQVSFQGSLYHPSGASNPEDYDFREDLLRRGIRVGLYGAGELMITPPASFSLRGAAASLRHLLIRALRASPLGEEAGGYAAAMLLGNRTSLSREDRSAFSRLGIAHILSVSGFHVGVLIGFLALLFRWLRLPQGARLGLYALVLGGYVLLCGSGSPVLRASLLLLLSHRGRMLRRPRSPLHLLAAAWILMLLWSPVQLTGLSFQLSFGAVLGIALVSPFLRQLFCPAPPPHRQRLSSLRSFSLRGALQTCWWNLRVSLAAGLGAQLGVLLPSLNGFQELPLLAWLINIPLLFWSGLIIGVYWMALITLPLPWLSLPFCALGREMTALLLSCVRFLGRLPGIALWTQAPNLLSALALMLLLTGLCAMLRLSARTRRNLVVSGVLALTVSLIPLPHGTTEYLQFSVGSADAALLWDRDAAVVIDTGYEDGVLSNYLHRRRLTPDAVILTHLHADHAGGLRALREDRIPVPVIYLPDRAELAEVHPDMLALLEEYLQSGTEIRRLSAGDRLTLPSGEITVLWPEILKTRTGQDANLSSLVLRLLLKGTSLLQMGDLSGTYEMYAASPSDLLKVAHHGSPSSSSEAFLAAVRPQTALLSCGSAERHAQFRQRLGADTALYSTAVHGLLTVRFTEDGYTVTPFLPEAAPTEPNE